MLQEGRIRNVSLVPVNGEVRAVGVIVSHPKRKVGCWAITGQVLSVDTRRGVFETYTTRYHALGGLVGEGSLAGLCVSGLAGGMAAEGVVG